MSYLCVQLTPNFKWEIIRKLHDMRMDNPTDGCGTQKIFEHIVKLYHEEYFSFFLDGSLQSKFSKIRVYFLDRFKA